MIIPLQLRRIQPDPEAPRGGRRAATDAAQWLNTALMPTSWIIALQLRGFHPDPDARRRAALRPAP